MIDLGTAIGTVDQLRAELERLNGVDPDKAPTRAAHRQRVELSRTLLYAAHLADRARIEVMEAYHAYKAGADPIEERGGP